MRIALVVALALVTVACGGGSRSGSDPGEGTQTLIVQASASIESGDAGWSLEVRVERAGGIDVLDAVVEIESDAGDMVLVSSGDGRYAGSLPVDASWFGLSVEAGEDGLSASIDAPAMPVLEHPALVGLDPHAEADGLIEVSWSGSSAQHVRVKLADFQYEGVDEGSIDVPASAFDDDQMDLELDRRNSVTLLGGVGGSTFEASAEHRVQITVTNPY